MTQILQETYLDYSDILIKPKLGNNLNSRKEVNLIREYKFKFGEIRKGLGVFNANMFTVGNFAIAKQLLKAGMFATIHKFYTPEEIMNFYKECEAEKISTENLFISIGIKNGYRELDKLNKLKELGWNHYKNICIDAANFYVPKAFEVLQACREQFPDSVILCGNIASLDICSKLSEYADIIKGPIGSGSCCTTRKQTACGSTCVSFILEVIDYLHNQNVFLMADGGITEIADICKAFALGSDFVMIGGMFGGVLESDSELIEKQYKSSELGKLTCKIITKKFKSFYGMSSKYANEKFFGGFSKNMGDCERAYRYILENVVPSAKAKNSQKIGEFIHQKFNKIVLNGEYCPEFAKFLVECGIESMSLNPDTMIKTRLAVAEIEKKLKKKGKK